ncbi:hypothetical protein TrRE_jg3866, partial [Triparma retinervis]
MKVTRAKHAMDQSIFQSSSQSRASSSQASSTQASSTQASSTTSPPIPTNPQPFTLLSTTKCPSSGSHTLTFSDPSSYHARLPVPTGVKFHRVTKQATSLVTPTNLNLTPGKSYSPISLPSSSLTTFTILAKPYPPSPSGKFGGGFSADLC